MGSDGTWVATPGPNPGYAATAWLLGGLLDLPGSHQEALHRVLAGVDPEPRAPHT